MLYLLLIIPLASAVAAFFLHSNPMRRALLLAASLVHSGLTLACWIDRPPEIPGGWLAVDPTGLLFLSITSLLFLVASIYAVGFLSREAQGKKTDIVEGFFFTNAREATFTGCLLLFLATMTMVTLSQHLGLLWVAVEATTLVSAPLIYFHRHHRSLEASWKYLMICSVGIALALLGNFFLAAAAGKDGQSTPMLFAALTAAAKGLDPVWLKAAFLLLLVGYGTKMGLAPLHTWLPDAHSEAPSLVSCLLSGALLNCAFLAILRVHGICVAAGQSQFSQHLLIGFGLLSMAMAAIFILGQADYKRMLAYSSVEHMGILALGIGLGGIANFAALLHAVNHSLTKAMLFLLAGNILAIYKTKVAGDVRGVSRLLPISGLLWLAGFLAITGSPPFGMFMTELTILKAAVFGGQTIVAGLYLLLLAVIFVGMGAIFLKMAQGQPNVEPTIPPAREPLLSVLPPAVLACGTLLLGIYLPAPLQNMIAQAAASIGVN